MAGERWTARPRTPALERELRAKLIHNLQPVRVEVVDHDASWAARYAICETQLRKM